MTYATIRAAVEHAVRQGHLLPHQLAALTALDKRLTDEQRRAFTDDWRADGSPAAPPPAPAGEVLIRQAPYFPQRDSATGQGDRMCFSSTCAMAAETLRPGVLAGPGQPDDRYLRRLQQLGGDTTDVAAQIRTLRSLGFEATFRQDMGEALVESELVAGRPVPVGWLHHGPVAAPRGGGHWSLIVGATKTHWILHDPFGEADLVGGGYASTAIGSGKFIRYTRRNFNRRWMVEPWNGGYRFAPGRGWALLLRVV
jgi:hypothetical protein